MTATTPDLSVVISSYNRNDGIRRTLERLFESALPGRGVIEVVIIDDGSPRPVEAVVNTMTVPAQFELRVIRTENRGIGAARNRGYAEAAADIVILLDDDVLVAPDTVRKLIDAHAVEPCGLIFGIYPFADHESESLRKFAAKLYDYDTITVEPTFVYVDEITSGLLAVRKSKLGPGKIYQDDLSIPAAEEHELIFRFSRDGQKIARARHISAVHNHRLDLKWMAEQQYKYGQATAEAFEKYPDITQMDQFAAMKESLDSGGLRGLLKDIAASRAGRGLLLFFTRILQRIAPGVEHDGAYGALTAAYMRGGYKDGLSKDFNNPSP